MNGRLYDPLIGRFLSPDPYMLDPFFSQDYNRYSYARNNPFIYTDPSGELAWFVPIIAGAVIGSYFGKSLQTKDWNLFRGWKDGYQGAISGAFIGATVGAMFSAAFASGAFGNINGFHTTGVLTKAGTEATKAFGITQTMLNSATLNIANNAIFQGGGWDGAWKAGITGALSGGWTASGGFGFVKKDLLGKTIYQNVGLGIRSIGNNLAQGRNAFYRYNIGIGPLQFAIGKEIKWHQSLLNVNNVINGLPLLNNFAMGDYYKGVSFDRKNLMFQFNSREKDDYLHVFTGFTGESGAYAILSRYKGRGAFDLEEVLHGWQSRSMGDAFLFNYFFSALPILSVYNFNYYEATAGHYWLK